MKDKGPGGHILTGPIYIEGAEPGDTLEVRIQKIDYAIPYAYNSFSPQQRRAAAGGLPQGATKIIPLDTKRSVAKFAEKIEIPLRPFFGSMGVAPPEASGRVNSAPPGVHAGNLDNKDLVAGTTSLHSGARDGRAVRGGRRTRRSGQRRGGHHGPGDVAGRARFSSSSARTCKLKWPRARDADPLHRDGPESRT